MPIIKYLIRKSKKITILNLYHIRVQTAVWAIVFKVFNPHGKIYLKCDNDLEGLTNIINNLFIEKNLLKLPKKLFILKLLQITDLITIETRMAHSKFLEFLKKINVNQSKVHFIPNGCDVNKYKLEFSPKIIWAKKENIILNVGRIGTKQKNTEIILESFMKLNPKDWKLMLIGPIEKNFTYFLNDFFKKCPKRVKNKIIFTGPIYDKNILYSWFCRSKIFYFPSRWESCAHSLVEAMFFMNYLVATKKDGSAIDITENGKYGKLVEIEDVRSHMKGLDYAINLSNKKLLEITSKVRRKIEKEYNWDRNVDKIFSYFYSTSTS